MRLLITPKATFPAKAVDGAHSPRFNTTLRAATPEFPNGQIAQLVEQRTENPRVDSSILSLATIYCSQVVHSSLNLLKFSQT